MYTTVPKKYKVVWYGGLLSLTRKINVAIIIRVFTTEPLLGGEEFDLPFSYNLQVCWPAPSEKGPSVEGTQMGGFSHKSRLIIATLEETWEVQRRGMWWFKTKKEEEKEEDFRRVELIRKPWCLGHGRGDKGRPLSWLLRFSLVWSDGCL